MTRSALLRRDMWRRAGFIAALAVAAAAWPAGMNARQAATSPASAPATNSASPSQHEQAYGTGTVPPGVKLAPQMPPPGPPRPFHFPRAASKTLPNGLRVFVVSDHSAPAIALRLVILSAGRIQDPAGMPGTAEMTASMLTQGTARRSAREIAEAIDFVGGTLEAGAGPDGTNVALAVVRKDLDTGLDVMSDCVLHPSFRAEELERQRQQLLSELVVDYSAPEQIATMVFERVVYGDSPYGWPEKGTPETVKKLTPEELARFHDARYAPNQSLLAFAGDITPERAFAVAEKYFGAWHKLDIALTAPPAPPAPKGLRVWLIDKPGAVQTQIRAGSPGIRRGDPDYIPVVVMNRIFGGGYNSRLNTIVRVKQGLTYGAYSEFEPHLYAGSFEVATSTRTEATVEATKLVVDLIGRMSAGDVTQDEVNFAEDFLAGVYPIQTEKAEQVADRVLAVAAFDLPAGYNSTYPARIRGVTSAQVREMARRYLTTSDLDLVLVGDTSAYRDALEKAFPEAKYEEIPIEQVDVLAPDLRKATTGTAGSGGSPSP